MVDDPVWNRLLRDSVWRPSSNRDFFHCPVRYAPHRNHVVSTEEIAMNLIDVYKNFATDEQCLDYLEQMRWHDGIVRCPTCGAKEVSRITRKTKGKNKRTRIYQCLEKTCGEQFSVTA